MRIRILFIAMVFALLGVMSSSAFGGLYEIFNGGQEDPKAKYRELETIIQNEMEEQANQNTTEEMVFNWEFIEFKKIPDCEGQVHNDYRIEGLFYPAGGKSNVFRVANKKTFQSDGHITVQVCLLSFMRKVIGGTVAERHYRVYTWRYDLPEKTWSKVGVKAHIRTWPCKKKPIKDVDWTYEDVCGSCVSSGGGGKGFWQTLFGN